MRNFDQTVNTELLEGRFLVLELAALLDRIDEAAARDKRSPQDVRLENLRDAIGVVASSSAKPDRTERILRIYSDPEK